MANSDRDYFDVIRAKRWRQACGAEEIKEQPSRGGNKTKGRQENHNKYDIY